MDWITNVYRIKRQRHLEKLFQLGHTVQVILAVAGTGEHDIVVVKTFRIAVTMECVGHRISPAGRSFTFSAEFVILPNPVFVFARSNLYPRRFKIGPKTFSLPSLSQRVPAPRAITVSISFSTWRTSSMISSVRSTFTFISTMAERTFSSS